MMRGAAFGAALLVVCAAALFLRLPDLGNRPFHADEAVHAVKLWEARQHGAYIYDPDEFHGPTLYWAAAPFLAVRGRANIGATTEADYRLGTVAMGILLVLLLALLHDGLGRRATLVSASMAALAPAFVFYSRYFIQETLLVCFTVGALGAWWRHAVTGRVSWAIAAGAFVGLMVGTKETAALTLGAWVAASLLTGARPNLKALLGATLTAAFVAAILLTDLGRNAAALADYARSYAPWFSRAHGTGLHGHAWTYYLAILAGVRPGGQRAWIEAVIPACAIVGIACAAFRRPGAQADGAEVSRFRLRARIAVSSVILLAAYSAVPYKTPWCVLTPLAGLVLLGGMGATWLVGALQARMRVPAPAGWAVGLVAAALIGRQAHADAFRNQVSPKNPYVYAQTVPDAEDIQRRAEALAGFHPDGLKMVVKVIWTDNYHWPIPWYLRRFPNVGYWTSMPDDPDAPLILAAPVYDEELTRRLDATHIMNGYIGLRPSVVTMFWVRMDVWTRYVEHLQRNRPLED